MLDDCRAIYKQLAIRNYPSSCKFHVSENEWKLKAQNGLGEVAPHCGERLGISIKNWSTCLARFLGYLISFE